MCTDCRPSFGRQIIAAIRAEQSTSPDAHVVRRCEVIVDIDDAGFIMSTEDDKLKVVFLTASSSLHITPP